ncbi:pneumococcal-type histidine triad protein [Streptococcus halotolerans]|uniref:pneumococcal-type histidine triad protein n=1 Tax=Streptococcus halotolerans TaxID=1814128 RepID=UPI0007879754|nr:pneumococcal-type histidine triad protein [Streptococcus halotolerans]
MKQKQVLTAAAAVALLASVSSYQLGRYQAEQKHDNQVAYVNDSKANKSKIAKQKADKSPEQISNEEGITAEQIVVKITDKGYVTSHGDHYHYYNGKVPYNALISEELMMKDPNYVFNESDVVNEVKDGYIIKVNGKYYLYLKEGSKRTNLRTKEQIAQQVEKGTLEAKQHGGKHGRHSSSNAGSPEKAKAIKAAKKDGRYTTDDGYIFSPTDVVEDTGDAFIVPHGNHFHYIPKADLSAGELAAAQSYWNKKSGKSNSNHSSKTPISAAAPAHKTKQKAPSYHNDHQAAAPSSSAKPNTSQITKPNAGATVSKPKITKSEKPDSVVKESVLDKILKRLYAQSLSERHVESDGLVYDPAKITSFTKTGVSVPHGNHFHFIHYKDMSPLELETTKQVAIYHGITIEGLTDKKDDAKPSSKPTSPKKDDAKPSSKPTSPKKDDATPSTDPKKDDATPSTDPKKEDTAPSTDPKKEDTPSSTDPKKEDTASQSSKPNPSKTDSTKPIKPIVSAEEEAHHVTPKEERKGKPNSQIVYSPEEIAAAKAAGKYTTSDGYIFDAKDIKEDAGSGYVIPHMTHEHWVPKKDLSKEELKAAEDFLASKEEESGSSDEVNKVRKTKEIYEAIEPKAIVDPDDLIYGIAQATQYRDGTFVIPHKNHYHYVKLDWFDEDPNILKDFDKTYSLEDYLATAKYYMMHPEKRPKVKEWGNDAQIAKDADKADKKETPKKSDKQASKKEVKKLAHELFEEATPKKIVPLDQIRAHMAYAVGYENKYLIVPHLDHYHNVPLHWFDGGNGWEAPEGYSLSDLFSTIKYYMQHRDELPKEDGWGDDSDHGKTDTSENEAPTTETDAKTNEQETNDQASSETDANAEAEDDSEELDEFDLALRQHAQQYGMDPDTFEDKLLKIALKYGVSMENFSYPGNSVVQLTKTDGSTVRVNIQTLEEIAS